MTEEELAFIVEQARAKSFEDSTSRSVVNKFEE